MKSTLVLVFLLLNALAIQSDPLEDISAEFESWKLKLLTELDSARNKTIAAYVQQGVLFTQEDVKFKRTVIDVLLRNKQTVKIGRDILNAFTANKNMLNNYFKVSNLISLLEERYQSFVSSFKTFAEEKIEKLIAAASSDPLRLLSCWDSQKAGVQNVLLIFANDVRSTFNNGLDGAVDQIEMIAAQRAAYFKTYATKAAALKNNPKRLMAFVSFYDLEIFKFERF